MHVSDSISLLWVRLMGTLLVAIHLTTALAADILLSTTTAFSLLRSQNGAEYVYTLISQILAC